MTWNCADIKNSLDDYLDNELSSIDKARFEVHLESCSDCSAYVACENRLIGELAILGRIGERKVDCRRVRDAKPVKSSMFVALQVGGLAAVLALMMTAALFVPSVTNTNIAPSVVDARTDDQADTIGRKYEPFVELKDQTRLAVRVASADERFHIFWLYDTIVSNKRQAESINSERLERPSSDFESEPQTYYFPKERNDS